MCRAVPVHVRRAATVSSMLQQYTRYVLLQYAISMVLQCRCSVKYTRDTMRFQVMS